MNCKLCGSPKAWYSDWRKQWVCSPCFQKKEMVRKCPSCGEWMGKSGIRGIFLLSRTTCESCYRSPFTKGGWRRDSESPLANAVDQGIDGATGMLTWGFILLVLAGALFLFIAFSGGIFALDLRFSHWLNARSQFWGDVYVWGPKILIATLLILPPIILTKRT